MKWMEKIFTANRGRFLCNGKATWHKQKINEDTELAESETCHDVVNYSQEAGHINCNLQLLYNYLW